MTVQLISADLVTTVVELRRAHASLDDARHLVGRDVDVLLDGGWAGQAATAFAAGWDEWRAGCVEVLGALDTMAALVDLAMQDQTEVDSTVAAAGRVLQGRLG